MITWILYLILAPVTTFELYAWAWCGVWFDMFIFGQIYQKIEKVINNHRK